MVAAKNNKFAIVWLILSQCSIAINIVYMKQLLSVMHLYTILFFRFTIGFSLLAIIQLIKKSAAFASLKQQSFKDWLVILMQALCAGFFFNVLMLIGLHHTSASMAGMIGSALPAIVVILSIIFLRMQVTWSMLVCVALAVLGLIIMNMPSTKTGTMQWFGDSMILLSMIPEGFYYILTKRFKIKMPILLLSAMLNVLNVPLMFLLVIGHHHTITFTMPLHQWYLLFMVGASVAACYVFWFLGCERVHGVAVGLSTTAMPIATIWFAFLILGETVHLWQIIGMCVVLTSVAINALYQKKCTSQVIIDS